MPVELISEHRVRAIEWAFQCSHPGESAENIIKLAQMFAAWVVDGVAPA